MFLQKAKMLGGDIEPLSLEIATVVSVVIFVQICLEMLALNSMIRSLDEVLGIRNRFVSPLHVVMVIHWDELHR